jgi:hypothetical protein
MTPEEIEAFGRLHQAKCRLLTAGWTFVESGDEAGFDVTAQLGHDAPVSFRRHFYSDALEDAIRYASHAQARRTK